MSSTTTNTTGSTKTTRSAGRPERRVSTETKSAFKTTEMIAYVVTVLAVLIAAAMVDEGSDFGAQEAWRYVTFLTIGYMISRGLAKAGSRDFYDDRNDAHND